MYVSTTRKDSRKSARHSFGPQKEARLFAVSLRDLLLAGCGPPHDEQAHERNVTVANAADKLTSVFLVRRKKEASYSSA
jgi:hypothetical protein